MIRTGATARWSIWEHSQIVRDLYTARARDEEPEMDCARQAVELLTPMVTAGDTLLDAGCGSGYFFHSLRKRSLPVEYYGVDSSPTLTAIGRRELEPFGLPSDRIVTAPIDDIDGEVDHVVCMNVLSNIDNFHRPLERLLAMARKSLILRESATQGTHHHYVVDRFLDDGLELRVHVNHYDRETLLQFMRARGFDATMVTDQRTGGQPESVIGHDHHWTFFVAQRVDETTGGR